MSEQEKSTVNKARTILDQALRLPADRLLDGLRQKGIIDDKGQMVEMNSGHETNGESRDQRN